MTAAAPTPGGRSPSAETPPPFDAGGFPPWRKHGKLPGPRGDAGSALEKWVGRISKIPWVRKETGKSFVGFLVRSFFVYPKSISKELEKSDSSMINQYKCKFHALKYRKNHL